MYKTSNFAISNYSFQKNVLLENYNSDVRTFDSQSAVDACKGFHKYLVRFTNLMVYVV